MDGSVAATSTPAVAEHPARAVLLLGALGVVFGDIGTSPIYAFRESLKAAGDASTQATVLGGLSMMFWAIFLIVAVKYVVFVMRADNDGEGGTMSLLSLALPVAGRSASTRTRPRSSSAGKLRFPRCDPTCRLGRRPCSGS